MTLLDGASAVKRVVPPVFSLGNPLPAGAGLHYAVPGRIHPRSTHQLDITEQRKIKIGACAWTYDDWRGCFYPAHVPQNERLEYYARFFPAVEVDSTFYRAPGAKAVDHWLAATPDDFRFSCKMPKKITHELRLRDCEEPLNTFLERLEPLRPKLGCILIQLPPKFRPAPDEKTLKQFLALLPSKFRFAVEFRHLDWHLPRIVHHLEDHGVCWAWTDTTPVSEQNRGAFEPMPQTAKFLYVRLLGDLKAKYNPEGDRIHRYTHLQWPRDTSLENWAVKIQKHLSETTDVYLNCSNHFEGFAPLTCQRLARHFGIAIDLPAAETESPPQKQMDLL